VLRRGESWDGWLPAVWEGRGGMGKKKGKKKEKQRKRGRQSVSRGSIIYWICRRHHRRKIPSVKPSVIPPVLATRPCLAVRVWIPRYFRRKCVWKKSTSSRRCNFQKKNFSPSVIPPVYTDEIIPSVYTGGITDGCFPSVNSDRFWDGIISIGKNCRRK